MWLQVIQCTCGCRSSSVHVHVVAGHQVYMYMWLQVIKFTCTCGCRSSWMSCIWLEVQCTCDCRSSMCTYQVKRGEKKKNWGEMKGNFRNLNAKWEYPIIYNWIILCSFICSSKQCTHVTKRDRWTITWKYIHGHIDNIDTRYTHCSCALFTDVEVKVDLKHITPKAP
jgi:hypothetical protein